MTKTVTSMSNQSQEVRVKRCKTTTSASTALQDTDTELKAKMTEVCHFSSAVRFVIDELKANTTETIISTPIQ